MAIKRASSLHRQPAEENDSCVLNKSNHLRNGNKSLCDLKTIYLNINFNFINEEMRNTSTLSIYQRYEKERSTEHVDFLRLLMGIMEARGLWVRAAMDRGFESQTG